MTDRRVTALLLPLPDAHLDVWREFDEAELCAMARCLHDGERRDLPDGIAADLVIWGDAPALFVAGLDLAAGLSVEWPDALAGELEGLAALLDTARQHPLPFAPALQQAGQTCLLYCAEDEASYTLELPDRPGLDVRRLALDVRAWPDSDRGGGGHHILEGIAYADRPLWPELEESRAIAVHACLFTPDEDPAQ